MLSLVTMIYRLVMYLYRLLTFSDLRYSSSIVLYCTNQFKPVSTVVDSKKYVAGPILKLTTTILLSRETLEITDRRLANQETISGVCGHNVASCSVDLVYIVVTQRCHVKDPMPVTIGTWLIKYEIFRLTIVP